ncbi:low temperature requirement protein A [Solihabitans fulvus]|uniref:Low temperature requirement protein A n=3 Tax=Solihabitans fulvus TaxID=1892852 RepID=A0A5B2XEY1_9PSEU|nr:low temperature requirement protein A [Solihabitans fulvus]
MVGRDQAEPHRASTPLELLFDLSFVVAVAQGAGQLHHSLAEGQVAHGVIGYAVAFFAIWWAWVNFTWFASAYDTDDVLYRLLTLVQIAGALVLAAGIPAAFERFDFTVPVIGYVIMRLALLAQWLRAARDDPAGRPAALRYAVGVSVCQVAWILRLFLPVPWSWIAFVAIAIADLLVPLWAETRGSGTSWHPGHIAERYGLFTLIVLGESISAATLAIQSGISDHGVSVPLMVIAAGGLILLFGLWWSYFKHDTVDDLDSLDTAAVWAYVHFGIFAAIAAVGAGLQVVAQTANHTTHLSPTAAAYTVAVPVAVFLVLASVMRAAGRQGGRTLRRVLAGALLVLVVPLASGVLSLAGVIVAIGLILAALITVSVIQSNRRAALATAAG